MSIHLKIFGLRNISTSVVGPQMVRLSDSLPNVGSSNDAYDEYDADPDTSGNAEKFGFGLLFGFGFGFGSGLSLSLDLGLDSGI